MYGKIWSYSAVPAHRFTAKAMLAGALHMRGSVLLTSDDEEVYSGATFTHWGFGVPLLELPFHTLATWTRRMSGFFPDRAVYFFYFIAALPGIAVGFRRLVARRFGLRDGKLDVITLALTWLVLCLTLYPLMATRFIVYEMTIAYFTILQLLAISAYVYARQSTSSWPIVAMAAGAGMGLLVRHTGLVYLGVWGLLVLLLDEGTSGLRDRLLGKRFLTFSAVVSPFVAFWLFTNSVKTGSPIGLGFANSNPYWGYDVTMQRFGSPCSNTPLHTLEVAVQIFGALFFFVSKALRFPHVRACHFALEERDSTGEPYLGPAALVFLAWIVYRLVSRRERRLALYVPLGAFALLFVMFVRAGAGIAWRYAGDLWPAIFLSAVLHVESSPPGSLLRVQPRLAAMLFGFGALLYLRYLVPWEWSTRANIVPAGRAALVARDFAESWPADSPIAHRLDCGAKPTRPYHNGFGWLDGCRVDTFTQVYLGVVPKGGVDRYRLHMRAEGFAAESVRVHLNGGYYTATKVDGGYDAAVEIPYGRLTSPIVMVTVEWTRAPDPPPSGKLLSIELE
jgi:hypothetical protein